MDEALQGSMAGCSSIPPLRLLKLCYKGRIGMVTFGPSEDQTMESLLKIIRKTCSGLQAASSSTIVVSYVDVEGETITVETDEELRLALEVMSKSRTVGKFTITENAPAPAVAVGPLCKFFQRGYCRNGSRCRDSHSSIRSVASSPWTIDRWLERLLKGSAANNIEELSSPEGLQMLGDVASGQLRGKAADMLAKLLTKDEIRSSMLRHETNRIYGSIAQSRFVLQLQVHMNDRLPRTDETLKPYLLLIEELYLRTSDGWKCLPLDAAGRMIQDLQQTPLKNELAGKLDVLLEHRRKLQLQMATTNADETLEGPAFRKVAIIPSKEELFGLVPAIVPVNKVGLRYTSVVEYLETHFRLLREDFIEPLRQGIKQYMAKNTSVSDVRIYCNVELKGVRFTSSGGMESKVSFAVEEWTRPKKASKEINWERLMFGSLLCMSSDNFETVAWATVVGRNDLARNEVAIRLVDGSDLDASTKYVMAESSAAYFEAYSHVLKRLQGEEMEKLPFQRQLISLERDISEPAYLTTRAAGDLYDFSSAFPEIVRELGRSSFHVLEDWPEWACTLDLSQRAALKHALTKSLALIQGPPGTGKTFVGLLIVQVLLANLKKERTRTSRLWLRSSFMRGRTDVDSDGEEAADVAGPVLIVCYTNHALDQFLEGVYRFEERLVRIGGRGKSKLLDARNLQVLLQQQRDKRDGEGPQVRALMNAKRDRIALEDEICRCVEELNAHYVTEDLLHGVATEDQIYNLFHLGRTARKEKNAVKAWLDGGSLG